MVHLVVHLIEELRMGGPVTYRWMYSSERELLTLKSYVHNRAYPEGSIAEVYLAMESLTFVSRYLSGVETLFTRPVRNDDEGEQNEIEELNSLCPGRPLRKSRDCNVSFRKRKRVSRSVLDEKLQIQAHLYVLFNVESVMPFREVGVDDDNGVDVTPMMEQEVMHDEDDEDDEASIAIT
ncbi:unnamed protein product [Cuscuta epithymum]|uniref:DUF4218 domain-containing protein n=1 Tax=Cuscuta epithymum TaxID=186058 RepID=A0AAV0CNT1_9ASTE|nr:unnamed protein product [Cuscuta epithymum]